MATINPKQFFSGGKVQVVGNHSDQIAQQSAQPNQTGRTASGIDVSKHVMNPLNPNNQLNTPLPAQGLMANLPGAIAGGVGSYIHNVGQDFQHRGQNIINSVQDAAHGRQSPVSAGFQTAGQAAGQVGDFFGEALKPSINQAANALSNNSTFQKVANSRVGDAAVHPIVKYAEWARQHPEASRNLEATVNIAGLLGGEKPAQSAFESTANAAKGTLETVGNTAKGVTDTIGNSIPKPSLPDIGGIKTNIADSLTHIPQSAETALKETPLDLFNHYHDLGVKAISDVRNTTPMQYAGDVASKALNKIQDQLQQVGQTKGKIIDAIGHNVMDGAGTFARNDLWGKLKTRLGVELAPSGDVINTKGRLPSISNSSDFNLIKQVDSKLGQLGRNPTMREVDDAVDYIQNKLYDGTTLGQIPINGKVEGALKEVAGNLNGQLRKQGGNLYAQANSKYSDLMNLRNDLNKALGTDGNKGAGLMKQLFSPTGTAPRKLFADVKKVTGIDLANHASVAKFVMENLGDTRQANLLEQVVNGQLKLSKSGVVNHLIDKGITSLQDPMGKARRIISGSQKLK